MTMIDEFRELSTTQKEMLESWLAATNQGVGLYKLFKAQFHDLPILKYRKEMENATDERTREIKFFIRQIRKTFTDIEGLSKEVDRENKLEDVE